MAKQNHRSNGIQFNWAGKAINSEWYSKSAMMNSSKDVEFHAKNRHINYNTSVSLEWNIFILPFYCIVHVFQAIFVHHEFRTSHIHNFNATTSYWLVYSILNKESARFQIKIYSLLKDFPLFPAENCTAHAFYRPSKYCIVNNCILWNKRPKNKLQIQVLVNVFVLASVCVCVWSTGAECTFIHSMVRRQTAKNNWWSHNNATYSSKQTKQIIKMLK